jgi:hypothetical protein
VNVNVNLNVSVSVNVKVKCAQGCKDVQCKRSGDQSEQYSIRPERGIALGRHKHYWRPAPDKRRLLKTLKCLLQLEVIVCGISKCRWL